MYVVGRHAADDHLPQLLLTQWGRLLGHQRQPVLADPGPRGKAHRHHPRRRARSAPHRVVLQAPG